ncbi:MAG: hypothetical protein R3F39_23330 [Myxococcota bacterium]
MHGIATALLIAMGALGAPAELGPALVGGDPCALVEGVPGAKDPLRAGAKLRAGFGALAKAGADAKALLAAHRKLSRALATLLGESERVFRVAGGGDGDGARWQDGRRKKAKAWLGRWVMAVGAPLRIGELGFEPVPGLRAALMLTACRGGDREAAIRWGRRARAEDEGHARALAALLLLAEGREGEARELRDTLGDRGFLAPFVGAYLTDDAELSRRLSATAKRRVTTPAQEDAARAQALRLGVAP